MADVDTWSSKLRPDDVFQQFTEVFTTFSSSWIPQLELTPELLETNYGAVRRFAPCLELANESFLGKETITNAVSPLGDLISRLNNDTRDVLKLLVTDVLFCGSLIPVFLSPAPKKYYSLFAYTGAISRLALRPISPAVCEAILKELLGIITIGDDSAYVVSVEHTSLLSHLDMEAYRASTLEQRMFLLSLCHLTTSFRMNLINRSSGSSSLFSRIMSSPSPSLWMLANSGCDEQYFLNTCDVAASLSSVVSYHSSIASLILLGQSLANSVEQRLHLASKTDPAFPTFWGSSKSQFDYASAELASFRSFIQTLIKDVSSLLDAEIHEKNASSANHGASVKVTEDAVSIYDFGAKWKTSLLARHTLVRKWHREVQKLSAVFRPDLPVVLTEKIFSNDWHSSTKWMTARAALEHLFVPGCPTFFSRSAASRTLEDIACNNYHTQLALIEPEADDKIWLDFPWVVSEETSLPEVDRILDLLWDRISYLDGALISSREELFFGSWIIGHMSYWKAVWMGEKYFLISDPELQYYKVLTLNEVLGFINDVKTRVNPLDGSENQHFRARRLRNDDK